MSAIAGLWYRRGQRDVEADMAGMLHALAPYGPDRGAHWHEGPLALGHRLGALLPEDCFDHQPLHAGMVTGVATARLDNRRELGAMLALDPLRTRSMADSEFILAAWKRWGEDCPGRLLGDFSFALWDRARQRLFCARDPLGRHPLVYYRSDELFALASMPKGLFALAGVPRRLNEAEVVRRLRVDPLYTATPRDTHLFEGLRSLPAGYCLTATSRGETVSRYWAPDPERRLHRANDTAYLEEFRSVFDEAVRCRLRGVGAVGTQLSGGLDSSAVTVTAARLLEPEGRTLTAFTAAPRVGYAPCGAAGWPLDESHAAGLIAARHSNVTHVVMRPDGTTPLDALRRALSLTDRMPINPANAVWHQQICVEARRRGVRMLLTGQNGNATISYDGYARLSTLVRGGHWRTLIREMIALPLPLRTRLALVLRPALPRSIWEPVHRLTRSARPRHSALHPDLRAAFARDWAGGAVDHTLTGAHGDVREHPEAGEQSKAEAAHALARNGFAIRVAMLLRVDMGPLLLGTLAGWGIDSRDPTSDRRLVEFCLALPEDQYLRDGQARRLLRRAFADRLPAEVLARTEKGRQSADFHEGVERIRDQLLAELEAMGRSSMAARCLDLPWLRRMLEDWPKEGWRHPRQATEYGTALLRGVAMGRFILDVEAGRC